MVDANVERVTARLHGLRIAPKGSVRDLVAAMVPAARAGDFAQAMMDLGATLCRPRRPLCGACPLNAVLRRLRFGRARGLPGAQGEAGRGRCASASPTGSRTRARCGWSGGRRRGLLGAMPALPGPEWGDEQPPAGPALAVVRHVFTHFELRLTIVAAGEPVGEGWWQPLDALDAAGLPTLYRRAADAVLASRTALAAA